MYTYSFLVVTRVDWREHGVNAVHLDKDRSKLKVMQCIIPVKELGDLFSVIEGDINFDQVCETYDASGNDGPDNQGGLEPVGKWQFAVYCTGTISTKGLARQQVQRALPDPRGDMSYHPGDSSLWFLLQKRSRDLIDEDWLLEYAKFAKHPVMPATFAPFACKRHLTLFVHIHNNNPSIIKIVKMDWDQNVERSDEVLKMIGRKSKTTSWLCEANVLVTTLLQMADEESIDSVERINLTTK